MFSFDPPEDITKPNVFWYFWGVKREHWEEIGFIQQQRSTKLAVDALKRQNWCCSDVCILDFKRFKQFVERLKAALSGLR